MLASQAHKRRNENFTSPKKPGGEASKKKRVLKHQEYKRLAHSVSSTPKKTTCKLRNDSPKQEGGGGGLKATGSRFFNRRKTYKRKSINKSRRPSASGKRKAINHQRPVSFRGNKTKKTKEKEKEIPSVH